MERKQNYELHPSRSRSITPQIPAKRGQFDRNSEHNYRLRSKSRDRFMTIGKINSCVRSDISQNKINEQPNEDFIELNDNKIFEKSDTLTLNVIEPTKSQNYQKRFCNGETKIRDYFSNLNFKRESFVPRRIMTSDYSSEEGDRDDIPSTPLSVHEFYKQHGDYWNKFPKTDYTYSPTSRCRYEVAPGIIAIPNMSRRSLHSTHTSCHSNRTSYSLSSKDCGVNDNNTGKINGMDRNLVSRDQLTPNIRSPISNDQFTIIHRSNVKHTTKSEVVYKSLNKYKMNERYQYESLINPLNNCKLRKNVASNVDLDLSYLMPTGKNLLQNTQRFDQLITFISMGFFSILHFMSFCKFKKAKVSTSLYNQCYEESSWSKFKKWMILFMEQLYLLLVKILLLDSWLLNQASNIRKQVLGRPTKIIWIVFFPFIFTIGYWILPHIFSTTPLLSKSSSQNVDSIQITEKFYENVHAVKNLSDKVKILLHRVHKLEKFKGEQLGKIIRLENLLKNQNNDIKSCLDNVVWLQNFCQIVSQNFDEDLKEHTNKMISRYFGNNFSNQDVIKMLNTIKVKMDENNSKNDEIQKIVLEVLKTYDADKTGRVDYALESAGGQIISTRCTQRYNIHTRAFKIWSFTLFYESNNPRTVIQGNILQPGMCWAFQDFPGYLLVKLRSPIYVTGFTIEHAPKANLPNGEMKSAPKKFEVWGFKEENDVSPINFGKYEFLNSDDSLQYFSVQNSSIRIPYEYVELRIHSNHGQLEYTCLYRFRVHGNLE